MQSLENFWTLVVDVWESGLLGIDIGKILVAVAIFVAFLILRRFFGWVVVKRLKRWAERSSTRLDNKVIAALEGDPAANSIEEVFSVFSDRIHHVMQTYFYTTGPINNFSNEFSEDQLVDAVSL